MKRVIVSLAFILICTVSIAQAIYTTGKVSNTQGKAVPFAFVIDKKTQQATFSDSTGAFRLKTDPSSTLLITCSNYQNTSIKVENKSSLDIILSNNNSGANESVNVEMTKKVPESPYVIADDFKGYIKTKGVVEETQGSRYLFNNWVHGYVTDQKNIIHQDSHSVYNYDKVDGKLLITQDRKSVIEIEKSEVKTFTLFDQNALPYTFENTPNIDSKLYIEQLSAGKNYTIYKKLSTVLEKANFESDGVVSRGHNYDLYRDKNTYYVVKKNAPELIKIELRKKSIKSIFADQGDTLNRFMNEHAKEDINDNYLAELGDYLNK